MASTALATAPAAHSADDLLLVSVDGVNFMPDNTLPLFTDIERVVPGDSDVESVWLRSAASTRGLIRIDLLDPTFDNAALADALTLSTQFDGAAATRGVSVLEATTVGTCTVISEGFTLAPGQTVRLDITADVSPQLSDRDGVLSTVDFRLRGVLTDAAAASPLPVGAACDSNEPFVPEPPNEDLTTTGGASQAWLWALGALGVLGGIAMALIARRRRAHEHDESAQDEMEMSGD